MPEPRLDAKITADNTQFMRGLRQSTEAAKKTGASMAASFTKVAGLFGVGVGVGSMVLGLQQTAKELSKVRDLTARFGGDVEKFQKLSQVFEENGVKVDELGNAMTRLERKTQEAVRGNAGLQEAFANLGIEVDTFAQLSPTEKMLAFSDAIANSSDKSAALADAFKVLEDDAKKLFPLMSEGAENIEAQMGEVVAVNEETIDSYKRLEAATSRFWTNTKRGTLNVLGTMYEFIESIREAARLANKPFNEWTIGDLTRGNEVQAARSHQRVLQSREDDARREFGQLSTRFDASRDAQERQQLANQMERVNATLRLIYEQQARQDEVINPVQEAY